MICKEKKDVLLEQARQIQIYDNWGYVPLRIFNEWRTGLEREAGRMRIAHLFEFLDIRLVPSEHARRLVLKEEYR